MSDYFISHLEELRKRLIVSLIAFLAASILAYFFSSPLLDFLTEPLRRFDQTALYFRRPFDAFVTHIKVAATAGFIFSTPVIFSQIWLFVKPGLYEDEKKIFASLTVISVILFLAGAAFAYYAAIPFGLHFLLSFQTEGLKPLLEVGPYFSFVVGMIFGFGILFDFPVMILGLVKLGAVNSVTLAKSRKVIIVLIFIAAAILTPSPDPVSQLFLAGPLILLFEVSLAVARLIEK